jgi:hypothetical protein
VAAATAAKVDRGNGLQREPAADAGLPVSGCCRIGNNPRHAGWWEPFAVARRLSVAISVRKLRRKLARCVRIIEDRS